jgi:hypothetical protein
MLTDKNTSQLYEWIIKIYDFHAEYLYEEDWGTELDWRRNIEPTKPDNNSLIQFVKLLICNSILVENKKIVCNNGIEYTAYKLHRSYKKKLKEEVIEQTYVYKFIERIYDIYV